jgi:carboxypeptidase T
MKYTRLLLVLSLFIFQTAFAQQQRYDRVKIYLDAAHTIRQLSSLGIETDHGDYRQGYTFTSDFSESEERMIRQGGFRYDVVIRDMAAYYVSRNTTPHPSSALRSVTCSSPTGYNVQDPVNFRTGSMGGFLTYQEMLDQLDSMSVKYPNLISARQQIDTCHSIEGRPIYWMRISDHPDSDQTTKPQILYTALHHAREPAGLTDMIYYMWYLLENYNNSQEVKVLVDNTEMYIIPCVNPDGYIYNETTNPAGGGLWRKNRRLNADATYGVDLNRNYGYNWGYDNVGSSIVTTDETYRGTAGFSEPEIQATKWFAEHHDFKIAVNYHTYSNMLIYPWGYIPSLLTPDSAIFTNYARVMTKNNGFRYGTGDQTVGYTTNGDSDDWMYGEQGTKNKIFSMTPESGSAAFGFWPPASEVVNVCRENFDLIYYAHKFLLKHLEIADISTNVVLQKQFWFKYDAQRLGLDSTGTYTVGLLSADPNVTVPATLNTITRPALLATITDSFYIQLNTSIAPNTKFSFVVAVNNGLYTYYDTITKKYTSGDTIFYNNCNAATAFTPTGTWGTTTASYTSATGSITDSPNGNYPDNSDTKIILTNPIDLRAATTATLLYQAKWQIEKGYDYVLIEASSDNGSTWNALCGLYTNQGLNQGNPTQSLYDGYQTEWVQEVVDLSDYLGRKVNLRFHIVSDQAVNYDGFYFDDLTVLGHIDSSLIHTSVMQVDGSSDWQIYPNPASDKVYFSPADLSGSEVTIYNNIGAEVKKIKVANSQIDLDGLMPGVYSVMVNKDTYQHAVRKLIIMR